MHGFVDDVVLAEDEEIVQAFGWSIGMSVWSSNRPEWSWWPPFSVRLRTFGDSGWRPSFAAAT